MADHAMPTQIPPHLREVNGVAVFDDEQGLRELLRSFAWEVALQRPADPARCIFDILSKRFKQEAAPKADSEALLGCKLTMENGLDIFNIQGQNVLDIVNAVIEQPRPWTDEAAVKKIAEAVAKLKQKDVKELEENVKKNMGKAEKLLSKPETAERVREFMGGVNERFKEWQFDKSGRIDNAPRLGPGDQTSISQEEAHAVRHLAFCDLPLSDIDFTGVSGMRADLFQQAPACDRPDAIVTVGPPGCGKSYLMKSQQGKDGFAGLPPLEQFAVIDPDKTIHFLNGGEGKPVNPASRPMANFINHENFLVAVDQRRPLIFDGTARDPMNTCGRVISRMEANNYRVSMVIVLCSYQACLERAKMRQAQTGRATPTSFINFVFTSLQSAVPIYIRNHANLAQQMLIYDNETTPELKFTLNAGTEKGTVEDAVAFAMDRLQVDKAPTSALSIIGCLAADPRLAAVNPHSAVELLALSGRTLLDLASTYKSEGNEKSKALLGCKLTMENGLDIFNIQGQNVLDIVNAVIEQPRPWTDEAAVKKIAEAVAKLKQKDVKELEENVKKNMGKAEKLLSKPETAERVREFMGGVNERFKEWQFDKSGRIDNAPRLGPGDQTSISQEEAHAVRHLAFCDLPLSDIDFTGVSGMRADLFQQAPACDRPDAIVTVGPPGCGKSYLMKSQQGKDGFAGLPPLEQFAVIDPDKTIHFLNGGEGKPVNPASRPMANFINHENFLVAVDQRRPLIFDGSGREPLNICGRVISRMEANNYRVSMVIVLCSYQACLERAKMRQAQTGRATPTSFINFVFTSLQSAVPIYIRNHANLAQQMLIYDNETTPELKFTLNAGTEKGTVEDAVAFAMDRLQVDKAPTSALSIIGCLAADPRLAAVNPHSAVELLALSGRTLLDLASDSASRMRIESGDRLKLMQFNVFEDGLTDAPGAIGFPGGFRSRADALLAALALSADGVKFMGFETCRDFSRLPDLVAIQSLGALMTTVDIAYNVLYHAVGGETRWGEELETGLPVGNALRCLFLHSCPISDNEEAGWSTPGYEEELKKAVARAALGQQAQTAAQISAIRDAALNLQDGSLTWRSDTMKQLWKRRDNVWQNLWMRDLAVFLDPRPRAGEQEDGGQLNVVAPDYFCQALPAPAGDSEAQAMRSLIEVHTDPEGVPSCVRSLSLRGALSLLLERMCAHSLGSPAAAEALAAFVTPPGQQPSVSSVPSSAHARAALVLPELLRQMDAWRREARLENRHSRVCDIVSTCSPSIATLVEYDDAWRRLGPPAHRENGRAWQCARDQQPPLGVGQASVWWDARELELCDPKLVQELGLPSDGAVRSQVSRGIEGGSKEMPKSSCMVLLQRRESDHGQPGREAPSDKEPLLVLVIAVHLQSAAPSDTAKVTKRRLQLRSTLSEIAAAAKAVKDKGRQALVCLGGDFNAVREEFVWGNGPDFYGCTTTQAIRPSLAKPVNGALQGADLEPKLAKMAADGSLELLCVEADGAIDGGVLQEASKVGVGENATRVSSSRAGSSAVLDFLFCGSVGLGAGAPRSSPVGLATANEMLLAAEQHTGIFEAVKRWGSDHLPVSAFVHL